MGLRWRAAQEQSLLPECSTQREEMGNIPEYERNMHMAAVILSFNLI
jgi:hypothetical protein